MINTNWLGGGGGGGGDSRHDSHIYISSVTDLGSDLARAAVCNTRRRFLQKNRGADLREPISARD